MYNLRNNFDLLDAGEFEGRFGLLRTDFSPKPAYSAFKRYSVVGPSAARALIGATVEANADREPHASARRVRLVGWRLHRK